MGWESVQKSFALMRGKKDDIYVLYSLTSLNSDDGSQSLARRIR
jgi:hypothetical protein